jgi:DNA-directed RNA polymerase specialized sigma24 family protein
VNWLFAHGAKESRETQHATSEDFRRVFIEDAHRLYLLSFLLTANHQKAEQCFVAGLDEYAEGDSVFREWSRSWARRVIVRNAIRIMSPHPRSTEPPQCAFQSARENERSTRLLQDTRFANVLALENFERFVYVLSVLEGYSDKECFALLGTPEREVRDTRLCAIQHIGDFEREANSSRGDVHSYFAKVVSSTSLYVSAQRAASVESAPQKAQRPK